MGATRDASDAGTAGGGSPERVLLGWDAAGWRAQQPHVAPPSSCLDAAAAWLLHRHGPDLGRVVVALPGARAGRRLLECLVRRAASASEGADDAPLAPFVPPEITTAGRLTDRLLELDRPAAGRLARTLVWNAALRDAGSAALAPVVPEPPAADDHAGWWALAEELRALHGEIAAEGLDFEAVREAFVVHEGGRHPGREGARWTALAGLQGAYRERLAALGLGDPHEMRRAALEEGRLIERPAVVLVGVVELLGLQRMLLDGQGLDVTSLVFAPASHEADFDALGCVIPARWVGARIDLAEAGVRVADRPDDQARAVRDALAELDGAYAADAITIGVPDDEVIPWIEHGLRAAGLVTRRAAGTPLPRTGVARLLEAVGRLLERRGVRDLAALVRHPLVDAWLARRTEVVDGRAADAPRPDPASLLDAYHERHLPTIVPARGRWLGRKEERAALQALDADFGELLGELDGGDPRPLPEWAAPLRDLLRAVHEGVPLDRGEDSGHEGAAALEALDAALAEFDALPPDLAAAAPVGAAQAAHTLIRSVAAQSVPPRPDTGAVELLGWLELALDDAPVLILTGMNEGRVPEPLGGLAALPEAVRAALRLPDEDLRHARDAWALALMARSRERLVLIAGRHGAEGDPLLPSRLLFHEDEEVVVRRVQRVMEEAPQAAQPPHVVETGEGGRRARAGPALGPVPPLEEIAVTSFADWLRAPYLYYVQRMLGLDPADDTASELDPLGFGSLAHDVLEAFGRDETLRDATDADRIAKSLSDLLGRSASARYGSRPQPAVLLQLEQLRRRLVAFASVQAARAAEGWRIAAVEWRPETPVTLDVDGTPVVLRGRIDRIDVHADGRRWALLDYKTSNRVKDPASAHRAGDGTWRDLQLPLYARLAREFAEARGLKEPPDLGYVALPRELGKTRVDVMCWTGEQLAEADDEARRIVRRIRARELTAIRPQDIREDEHLLAALAGVGLLDEPEPEADGGEAP